MVKIRKGKRDNLAIFLRKNVSCDPSLELSRPGGSNGGSQLVISLRNKNDYH